jgi:hypothetical protein
LTAQRGDAEALYSWFAESRLNEQVYLAFPTDRHLIRPASEIRSTLIMSSQKTLREAGVFDEYVKQLPAEIKDMVLEVAAPRWLPLTAALGHYGACDSLGLSPARVTEIAQSVSMQAQGTFLGVAIGLARGIGVTPWTVLSQGRRIWERAWVGGAMAGYRLGPQEMRVEVVGWPCARIAYCRHALRGILLGVVKLLSKDAYVREIAELQTNESVAYRLTWRS